MKIFFIMTSKVKKNFYTFLNLKLRSYGQIVFEKPFVSISVFFMKSDLLIGSRNKIDLNIFKLHVRNMN